MMKFALSGGETAVLLARHVAVREGFDLKAFRCDIDVRVGLTGAVDVVVLTFVPMLKPVEPTPATTPTVVD